MDRACDLCQIVLDMSTEQKVAQDRIIGQKWLLRVALVGRLFCRVRLSLIVIHFALWQLAVLLVNESVNGVTQRRIIVL